MVEKLHNCKYSLVCFKFVRVSEHFYHYARVTQVRVNIYYILRINAARVKNLRAHITFATIFLKVQPVLSD